MPTDHCRCRTPRDSALLKEQYDKIYRYCFFKLHNQETAEDITQETFLRYLENYRFSSPEATLKCLYTIARHLCVDEFRRPVAVSLDASAGEKTGTSSGQAADLSLLESLSVPSGEDALLTALTVQKALRELTAEEQELLLLRYVNEVPVSVIARLFGLSRFSLRRRLLAITAKLRKELE